MRKYVIIFVMMLFVVNIYAQNNIDPPPIDSIAQSGLIQRNFDGFIKGWNWGSEGKELDKALGINFYHGGIHNGHSDYKDSVLTAILPHVEGIIGNGRNANQIFVALGIHIEPTIIVDSTENFRPRFGDRSGSVFGFNDRDFTLGDTSTDFERFVLHKNNLNQPKVVLKDIWDGTVLRWLDYD